MTYLRGLQEQVLVVEKNQLLKQMLDQRIMETSWKHIVTLRADCQIGEMCQLL